MTDADDAAATEETESAAAGGTDDAATTEETESAAATTDESPLEDLLATPVDPAAPFAGVTGRAPERLAPALAAIQAAVRESPSVADVVYEYRRAFPADPLVERHGDAYYLAVPAHVWPEFASATNLDRETCDDCRRVHAAAFRAVVGEQPAADTDPLVLVG